MASTLKVINSLRNHSDDLNLQVTCAKTWYQDVANMFKGLTTEINWIYNDVTEVGAAISVCQFPPIPLPTYRFGLDYKPWGPRTTRDRKTFRHHEC